jgi:hypothetical protein
VKKLKKRIRKVDKYHLSIISLLVAGAMLIAGIWAWFEHKNKQLEEELQNCKQTVSLHS